MQMLIELWTQVLDGLGPSARPILLGVSLSVIALLLVPVFLTLQRYWWFKKRAARMLELESNRERRINSEPIFTNQLGHTDKNLGVLQRIQKSLAIRQHLPVFVLGGVCLSFVIAFILRSVGFDIWLAILSAMLLGAVAPVALRANLRARWLRRFGHDFPAALDRLIRGLRSGLPLMECIELVAAESSPEVSTAFRQLQNDFAIGVSIEKSLKRMTTLVPLDEVRFFSVVVGLQNFTGGGLADMLETLADSLRKRRELIDKVQIMSQEARASAAIIGSLPVLVAILLFFISPDYVSMLFTTTPGIVAVIVAGMWMLLGIQVMRSMIAFES